MDQPDAPATVSLTHAREVVARFDARDRAITLDAYDDACETLHEAGEL